jgi:hypothetical protein
MAVAGIQTSYCRCSWVKDKLTNTAGFEALVRRFLARKGNVSGHFLTFLTKSATITHKKQIAMRLAGVGGS